MAQIKEDKKTVVILFAGDSGDGIQLTGTQFTGSAALFGNDVSTFPNFPAEIRAPQGTIAGVSGFQLHFGSINIYTAGDKCDVLVVMNAAALKSNIAQLKEGGVIIANSDGFDAKNLRLAKYEDGVNPIEDGSLDKYKLYKIDVTKLTRTCLSDSGLSTKEQDRAKNMFVLGYIYWMYNRDINYSIEFIKDKFKGKDQIVDANIKVLKAGYSYGDTTETPMTRYNVQPAPMKAGTYRSIMGNQATAYGLIAASKKSGLNLFYGSYPITPASDILHELAKHKNFGVRTFQAEDEIAAVSAAIGASFGGGLGVTASSGPGIALKAEAIGLAVMLELPLVICNVQRGGPSTGLPTKTEQADLFQVLYGRNSECPAVVVAAATPSDCFDMAYEACRIAIEHMTPVFFLSDGYIANGAEPWMFPKADDLQKINVRFADKPNGEEGKFLPYKRDEKLVRPWAVPGTKGLEHRVGGLEKEDVTGDISYDPENHEFMVRLREEKVQRVAESIPELELEQGEMGADVLVLGWGSTYGSIKTAVGNMIAEGESVAQAHLKYLNPFPKNTEQFLSSFKRVVIPEMNLGQLAKLIKQRFLIDISSLSKVKGVPFTASEIIDHIKGVEK